MFDRARARLRRYRGMIYDLEALDGTTIGRGLTRDQAAKVMADDPNLSISEARLALDMMLAGDRARFGALALRARLREHLGSAPRVR